MSEENKSKQTEPGTLRVMRSPQYRVIYANNATIGASPWDIHIALGQITGNPPFPVVNEEQVTVVVSPPQAKSIAQMLVKVLQEYEQQFGTINVPQEHLTPETLSVKSGSR